MAATDPTETHRLFQHHRVASGYARVRAWLESEILPLFGDESRPVTCRGYIQALRRP